MTAAADASSCTLLSSSSSIEAARRQAFGFLVQRQAAGSSRRRTDSRKQEQHICIRSTKHMLFVSAILSACAQNFKQTFVVRDPFPTAALLAPELALDAAGCLRIQIYAAARLQS